MKYSILVPCYNEADNIQNLVARLTPLQKGHDVEIVLIENGSKDDSRAYLKAHVENQYPDLQVVYVDENQGYGYGLQQGIKAAKGDYIGWIHADLQMPPERLTAFFDAVENSSAGADLFLKAHRTNRTAYELFFTWGQAVFSTLLFGKKMYDVAAVPLMFSRNLLSRLPVDDMPNDFSIDIYLYWKALCFGCSIVRPDIRIEARQGGDSSWNQGLSSRIRQSRRIISDSIQMKKGRKIL